MTTVSLALVPIFLIILVGYLFQYRNFPGQVFWPLMEKVIYFVLFPCLLFHSLSTAPLRELTIAPLASVLVTTILLATGLLILLRPWLPVSGPEFTSIFQGSIRFNGFVGIAVATTLEIPSGLALSALAFATLIPLINVLCVIVLTHYTTHDSTRWSTIGAALLRNPLIIACLLGIVLNGLNLQLPSQLQQTIEILGRAALPFGLLVVGAGLDFSAMKTSVLSVVISVVFRLLLFPVMTWLICQFWELETAATQIAVLFTAIPTATSSYILARQLGGDYRLMASIITLQTIVAAVTLPLVLTILK